MPPPPDNGRPSRGRVLIVIGDATETVDTLYPHLRLQEAGFEPVVIAPERREYQMVMHEVRDGWSITKEWEGYRLAADLAFAEVDPEEFLGIFFSGGRAPEYIRYDKDLVRITRHFFAAGKPVASVCHGVEVPAYADCVRGRRMTTVAKCRFDLEVAGGVYVDAPCVVDGNLVSWRTWHDHGYGMGPWIASLEAEPARQATAVGMPNGERHEKLLSRRGFTARAVAGLAAISAGAASAAAAPAAAWTPRFVVASCMYGTAPLETVLAELPRLGTPLVDLWPRHHGSQREDAAALGDEAFAALLEEHAARLAMTTRYDLGPARLREELPFLARHGGTLVVANTGGPAGLPAADLRREIGRFIEAMKPVVEAAEQHGVSIAIEGHSKMLVGSPDSLRIFAELAPSPRLGIALAPAHLPQDAALIAALVRDLGPALAHVYAWQHSAGVFDMKPVPLETQLEQLPGVGPLDFRPLMQALREIGYAGLIEPFMHPTPRGIPIVPETAGVTERIAAAQRHLLGLAES
jgi:protease I